MDNRLTDEIRSITPPPFYRKRTSQPGFATAAAAMAGLAISLVIAAIVAFSVSALRSADTQASRASAEATLNRGQLRAEAALLVAPPVARYAWSFATSSGTQQTDRAVTAPRYQLANWSIVSPIDIISPSRTIQHNPKSVERV